MYNYMSLYVCLCIGCQLGWVCPQTDAIEIFKQLMESLKLPPIVEINESDWLANCMSCLQYVRAIDDTLCPRLDICTLVKCIVCLEQRHCYTPISTVYRGVL